MPGCSIKFCPNWNGNTKHKGLRYFGFPKDPGLLSQWLKACGKGIVNLKNARVCSNHFSPEFIIPKPNHLIVPGDKDIEVWKLAGTAVPTRNLQMTSKQLKIPTSTKHIMFDDIKHNVSEPYNKEINLSLSNLKNPKSDSSSKTENQLFESEAKTAPVTEKGIRVHQNIVLHKPKFTTLSRGSSETLSVSSPGSSTITASEGENDFKSATQTHKIDKTKAQLVVLLDNNYGLSGNNDVVKNVQDISGKNIRPMNVPNGNMTNLTKTAVNGTNISQIENFNARSSSSPSSISNKITANALKLLTVKQNSPTDISKRCRSCLGQLKEDYKNVTCLCYLDKTIKDAIVRLVPDIVLPIQNTDAVCGKCFDILKDSLEFACKFKRSESVLRNEVQAKQKDALSETISLLNISPRYTPLRDNFTLEVADKIISLSKIDNNNLTKFVDTLQRNQVKIFQYENNPFSRKRVLLLGNPKLRRCYVCYSKFLSDSQLQDHLNSEHQITKEYLVKPIRHITASEEKPLTCRACNRTFLSEFNLKSHLKWCISFPCPHCEDHKTFACHKLAEHTRAVHGDNLPFKCCKCKKEFDDYKMYVKHSCAGHQCNTCGKKFQSTAALTYHFDRHKEVPCNEPFRNCPVCKEIVRVDNYSTHLLAHKKFICSQCGMRFYKSESLEDHEKTHEKEPKTYKCETCGKLFLKAETLQKHVENHQSESEITCEICSKSFHNIKNLKQHIMNIHGDPDVTCELCGIECKPEQLKQHIEKKHSSSPRHQCPLCSKSFDELMEYKKHMETHTNVKLYPRPLNRRFTDDILEENVETTSEEDENEKSGVSSQANQNLEIEESIVKEKDKEANPERSDGPFKRNQEENHQEDMPLKRKKLFNFGVNVSHGQMVCKYCLKSFSTHKSLKLHELSHFQNKRSEKCMHCDLRFSNTAFRIKHERNHGVKPTSNFRCNVCWRVLLNQEELDNHIESHNITLTCDTCGERFASQWQLDVHYASSHKEKRT